MVFIKVCSLYHLQYLSEKNSRHQDRIEMLEREIEQLRNLQRIAESAGSQAHTPYGVSIDMHNFITFYYEVVWF